LPILARQKLFGQSFVVLSRVLNRGIAFDRFSEILPRYIEPDTRYIPTMLLFFLFLLVFLRIKEASGIEKIEHTVFILGGIFNLIN